MDAKKLVQTNISSEMQKSYLDYAMSVIVARALPDVRDGLKPVQRRILYAMHEMNIKKYTKSAKIVGEVMGKYHPHGNDPIYDAMVRMAQEWNLRYTLVDKQGNFGSVDGDPPAAMRYTEARMDGITRYLMADIEKDTVDYRENFDATLKEPVYLPAILPNLLIMGAEGIAVGMATKIPPHNLTEVIDGIIATIKKGRVVIAGEQKNKEVDTDFMLKKIELVASGQKKNIATTEVTPENIDFESDITVEELIEHIPGPDFPTAGTIYGGNNMQDVYSNGRGRIVVRGVAEIEEASRGKTQIVISQIPYQVNKSSLVVKIAELAKNKKIKGVTDLRDESDKDGLRIVIELKRDSRPKAVLNNIYKYTKLQTTFPANFVALVDGVPHTLGLKPILVEYIKHRQKVITRRTIFELTQAKKRAHILEGLKIALDNLDAIIKTIRESRTQESAKKNLVKRFKLTEIQAIAILDMQLRRLAALERQKIEKEYEEIKKLIDRLISILKNPDEILKIITKELKELRETYGDKRKTKIYKSEIGEFSEEDLIPKKEVIITLTKTGYIKRVPRGTYKSQRRGGKGVVGMTTKEEDEIDLLQSASTHDDVLFFTDRGKVYGTKAWEIQEASRQGKGQALVNILSLDADEKVLSILPINKENNLKNLIMATKNGVVKKTSVNKFANMRTTGLIAIKMAKTDELVSVRGTGGSDHILLVTKKGKAIRFPEANARAMGRATSGVKGINLNKDDEVIALEVFSPKQEPPKDKRRKFFRDILTISENGLGKRTPTRLFPVQKRAGKGVKAATVNAKTGDLTSAVMVTQKATKLVITSKKGQIIKLPVKNIPTLGRITQGVILMRFAKGKGDEVAAVALLKK